MSDATDHAHPARRVRALFEDSLRVKAAALEQLPPVVAQAAEVLVRWPRRRLGKRISV